MDRINKEQRSQNMSRIRSKDTTVEVLVRKALYSRGIRYRKNYRKLPGSPDIVVTSKKIAIFINGCFWHGHSGCKYFRIPKSNTEYWTNKINHNINRDQTKITELLHLGWRVIIVWECEVKEDITKVIDRLVLEIKSS